MFSLVSQARALSLALLGYLALLGCGSTSAPAESPADAPADTPAAESATRPELTAEACAEAGGTVVGDIGDGAIHRAEYRCENGSEPSGNIKPAEGGPVAIEGSVCCPK
ncbi:MAG TPA: hypothetical protein VLC09_18140 [Polyangiaceae bacterium]|nr:hypothetical protein [Polyangiaceae bacterium]